MIQTAKTLAQASGGAALLVAALGGGSPEFQPAAAGLLALAAAAKIFGAGTEGLPATLRPWIPPTAGLALGALAAGWASWSLVAVSLIPLAGLLSVWPERRSSQRTTIFLLVGGFVGFLAASWRVNPHDAVLSAFWAAAAYPRFPKASLGLWGAAMFILIRSGDGVLGAESYAWASHVSLSTFPALLIGGASLVRVWVRSRGFLGPLLWLVPALGLGGWPAEAFFPLAAAVSTLVDASEGAKLPARPLWVLPSAWNPALSAPRFALGPGRVLAALVLGSLGAWGLSQGVAGRGSRWAAPVETRTEAELSAALRFRPLDSRISVRMAELAIEADAFNQAGAILDRTRSQQPRLAAWWRVKGLLLFKTGDPAGGLLHAARGLMEDPGDPRGYGTLGSILSGEEPGLAATILARGLRACPGEPGLLKGLAAVYEGMGKASAALPLYQASLALQGRDVESLRGICRTSYVRGREAETRVYLNRLRQLVPNDPWVHRYLQRLDQP